METKLIRRPKRWCSHCRKAHRANAPGSVAECGRHARRGRMTASECIRRGAAVVLEDASIFLSEGDTCDGEVRVCGCALGTAMVGKVGVEPAMEFNDTVNPLPLTTTVGAYGTALGLDGVVPAEHMPDEYYDDDRPAPTYADVVNFLHMSYTWTREQCAAWLERCGL